MNNVNVTVFIFHLQFGQVFSPSITYFYLTEIILKFNYILRGKAHCGGGKVICMFGIENIGGRIFLLHSFCQKWGGENVGRKTWYRISLLFYFKGYFVVSIIDTPQKIYIFYIGIGNRVLHWNLGQFFHFIPLVPAFNSCVGWQCQLKCFCFCSDLLKMRWMLVSKNSSGDWKPN